MIMAGQRDTSVNIYSHHKNRQEKNKPSTVCLGGVPDASAKPEFNAMNPAGYFIYFPSLLS